MPRLLTVAALAAASLGLGGIGHADEPAPAPAAPAIAMLGAGVEVSDLERALRFYTVGLGLTEVRRHAFGDTTEVILAFAEVPRPPMLFVLARGGREPVSAGARRLDKIVLRVSDADALAARLAAAGYAPSAVTENAVNHARGFWVRDSDGNAFEVTSPPPPGS